MAVEQWERRQGMRHADDWRWHRWEPCTDAEAQRVTGLQSWQVRRVCICAACDGTGWAPVGVPVAGKAQPVAWLYEATDGRRVLDFQPNPNSAGTWRPLVLADGVMASDGAQRELLQAAQAVVDRWDSPKWKDQPHTGEFIHRLRRAIAALGVQEVPPALSKHGCSCGLPFNFHRPSNEACPRNAGMTPCDAMPDKIEAPSADASETVSAIYRALSRGNNLQAQRLAAHYLDAKRAAAGVEGRKP